MLTALNDATDLQELESVPNWRLHQLTGDRKGTDALWVTANWRLTFRPDGATVEAREGATLLAIVRRAGRPIGFSCRGLGVCLACRLRVEGPMAPPSPAEQALLARIDVPGPWRIACLARIAGDVTVQADYW